MTSLTSMLDPWHFMLRRGSFLPHRVQGSPVLSHINFRKLPIYLNDCSNLACLAVVLPSQCRDLLLDLDSNHLRVLREARTPP